MVRRCEKVLPFLSFGRSRLASRLLTWSGQGLRRGVAVLGRGDIQPVALSAGEAARAMVAWTAGGRRLGYLAGCLPGLCDGAAPSKVEKMEAATARCRLVKE